MDKNASILEKAKEETKPDLQCKFIKYDGSDEVCQITAVFKQGEPLVICENWGLLKYESSSVASVKCDDKPWVERRVGSFIMQRYRGISLAMLKTRLKCPNQPVETI